MAKRMSRVRVPKHRSFDVTLHISLSGPGVTEDQIADYVAEALRYASAARVWRVCGDSLLKEYGIKEVNVAKGG